MSLATALFVFLCHYQGINTQEAQYPLHTLPCSSAGCSTILNYTLFNGTQPPCDLRSVQ